jgi:UDP-perosamine 4-acetyltransferase
LIEILRQDPEIEPAGLLDRDPRLHGAEVSGVKVLGDDSLLPGLVAGGIRHFFVGLGGTGDNRPRQKLYEYGTRTGCSPVSIIHRAAVISPSAGIGDGAEVLAGVIVNANARIGRNVILNTGAIVEHDCVIGDHVHVATGARLASGVRVGNGAHIGAGSTIRQCIEIGEYSIVGAGAVVVADVAAGSVVTGVPARPLKRREEPICRND